MKKQFLSLGKALSKAEQKQIFGGNYALEVEEGNGKGSCAACSGNSECASGVCATFSGDCSSYCGCGKKCL